MHDFGKITYLDLHKTGSTFISAFLESCCTLPQIKFEKHDWIREDYEPDCFYFISIRNPHDMWSSLYRYGLDKKGSVYHQLNKTAKLSQYESFNKFVDFCLDEDNADLLGYGYNREISKHIGFMSYRFLKLSLQFPMEKIMQCISMDLSLSTLEKKFITKLEIKNEKLNQEITRLSLELFPQYFDGAKVQIFMKNNLRINDSKTVLSELDVLKGDTLKFMHRKEWLLQSRY